MAVKVYGGTDYNTTDLDGKKSIVNNQEKIKNDPTFKQSEIDRTLAAISQLGAEGKDSSAQQKYLNVNLGYQAPKEEVKTQATPTTVQPQASSVPNTFSSTGLSTAIDKAATAGTNPTVQAAKYQTPEQLAALIQQMNGVLKPMADQQKASATSATNAGIQQMGDRFASRGMVASGQAAGQERAAVNELGNQVAGIDAAMQAQATNLGLSYANLQLGEDAQKFGQQANNRDFTQGVAQNNVNNLSNALGQQYGQQNALTGLNQSQQQINNQATQWDKQFNQNNMQWGQEFAQGQNQFGIQAALQAAGLFGQAPGSIAGANGKANPYASLFAGMGQTLDGQKLGEGQRQFDIEAAMKMSDLFGKAVNPSSTGQGLFDQVKGQQTQSASQFAQQLGWDKEKTQKAMNLDWFRANQDADYKGYLKDKGISEANADRATEAVISKATSFPDREAALSYLAESGELLDADGVKISRVLDGINKKWNKPGASSGNSSGGPSLAEIIQQYYQNP